MFTSLRDCIMCDRSESTTGAVTSQNTPYCRMPSGTKSVTKSDRRPSTVPLGDVNRLYVFRSDTSFDDEIVDFLDFVDARF